MKPSRFILIIGVLCLVAAPAMADGNPGRALENYWSALADGEYADAIDYLSLDRGQDLFKVSFRYIGDEMEIGDEGDWNEAVGEEEAFLRMIPWHRWRDYDVTVNHVVRIGEHARVFFTYHNDDYTHDQVQDMIYQSGRWRLE